MGRIFHWLPCVRSNSVKGNDSSMPTGPETPKRRTPAPLKGEKYNSKNHGWRSWGKPSALILKPESEDQRRDINEDMVKAIGEYMAQRPFQYRKKNEPEDQQKQQSTELVKEKSVKSLSKPCLETEIEKKEESAENELTSPQFVPAPIAAIESTKTPSSCQTHGEKCSNVKRPKLVQNSSTNTEPLSRPPLQKSVGTSSTSLTSIPSEESTRYAVLSREKAQTPQEEASVNRKPLEKTKSASHGKSLELDKAPSASGCKTPPVAPTHSSERNDSQAQCSAPRQPFQEKPLFTKKIAGSAERPPIVPILVREPSCVSSSYLTVTKDVRPTVLVRIEPPLVSNTSVITGSERVIDSKSRSKIYVSTGQGPRPTLSVVVNPPLVKSFISSNNELSIETKSGISGDKSTLHAKQHMLSAGITESELSNKTKAKLLKDPLGVTRSAASLGKQHAIEKMPSHLNTKQSSMSTSLKSKSAFTVDSDIGPSASKGMVRREKSKGSESSVGCSRPNHRYTNL